MRRFKLMLFSLIPCLVLVVVAELGLRVGGVDFEVRTLEVEAQAEMATDSVRANFTSDYFVPDPYLLWRPRPDRKPFNAAGYRGQELPRQKAAGELRILAVGDSNTLGHAATWVDELPRSVDPQVLGRDHVTTINAGAYGYTSHQGRIRLEEFLPYAPDVVLISFGGNDPALNVVDDANFCATSAPPRWIGKLRLLDAAWYLASRRRPEGDRAGPPSQEAKPELVARVSLEDYVANLGAMVERVRASGATPVIMTRPFAVDMRVSAPKGQMVKYHEATREAGRALGVAVVDVDTIAGHFWSLFSDQAHFNKLGHRVIGERIGRALTMILAGQSPVLEELLYRPTDPYDVAMSDFRHELDPADSLEGNVARLIASGLLAAPPEQLWTADLSGRSEPFVITGSVAAPHYRDGRLVLTAPVGTPASLVVERLPLNDDYGWVWIEAKGTGARAMRLYWSTGQPFDHQVSTADRFPGDDTLRPFSHLVPAGVVSLRLDILSTFAPAEVEITRVVLLRVPRRPA